MQFTSEAANGHPQDSKRLPFCNLTFDDTICSSVARTPPGPVTLPGLPWLRRIRNKVGDTIHFWPFDGWDVPDGKSVSAELYPSIFRNRYPKDDHKLDQQDAYCVARWLTEADEREII